MVSNLPSMLEYTSVSLTSISTPLAAAFLLARATALGFMSPQTTSAPFSAHWMDTMPDPVPISRTFSPMRMSRDSVRRMLSSDGGYTSGSSAMSRPSLYSIVSWQHIHGDILLSMP